LCETFSDYKNYIASSRESAVPFINNTNEVNWYKVSPAELSAIEEIPINIIMHPSCAVAYKKYGCVLLGICNNGTYMVGIPSDDAVFENSPFKQVIPSSDANICCRICTINSRLVKNI
jgi:hypothetical protein